jgi:hypothetical protein
MTVKNKVKLVMKQKGKPFSMNFGILKPLNEIGGVLFPYTPTIQFSHNANYGAYEVQGSQYQQNYYMNTANPTINVTALFSSNTIEEAKYTAAAIHFFKSCTKGDFGEQRSETAGTPPPILKFSAYGIVHASYVPVIMRNFNYTLVEDSDYVDVDIGNDQSTTVPTLLLSSIDLVPQLPPANIKKEFNIQTYSGGHLLKGGNKGGFI